jgi:peptidoglycan/LPS O-acetylase OafA/YrhL
VSFVTTQPEAAMASAGNLQADSNPEARKRNRRPDIQGLRAVAVLMVVAFHAGLPVPGGFVGVDVFFVISGFVITAMLLREQRATGRIRFGQFYLRRFKRLIPALALMVTVTMIISVALLSPLGTQQTAAKTGLGAMLLAANAVIARTTGGYFDADAATNPLLHTWTLSVEEQFYLAFPALIALGWYIASRRRALRFTPHIFVVSIAVVSFGLACFGLAALSTLTQHHASSLLGTYGPAIRPMLGFYSPVTRSWEFAVGVLLALAAPRLMNMPKRITTALGLVGASMLTASLWLISGTTPFPSPWTLIPVVGTLLALAAGIGAANPVTRALALDPMVKIGDWSYSIYLWHWPFIVAARALWPDSRAGLLIAACLSVIPAVASYYWFEKPIRNLQGLRGWRLARVVSITLLVPLFASAATDLAANRGYWSPGIRAMQDAVLQPHAMKFGCSPAANLVSGEFIHSCVWNANEPGKPIYLVGDSTAWHFSEAAIGASGLLGRPLTAINLFGCPFKDVFINSPNLPSYSNQKACREGYESIMRWLGDRPPGTVVISQLNSEYRRTDIAVGLQANALTSSPARRTQVLEDGLTSTIDTLKHAGHAVVLVQAAPDFEYPVTFNPLRCTWNELRTDTCIGRMPRSIADSIQQVERSSLRKIAAETGTGLFDPRDFFCSDKECTTQGHGVDLYRDAFHISVNASRMLAPSLAAALRVACAC